MTGVQMVQKSFKRARCWRLDGSAHAKKNRKKTNEKKVKKQRSRIASRHFFLLPRMLRERYSLGVTAVGEALGEVEVD